MSAPILSGDHEVVLTGLLLGVTPRLDGGHNATLMGSDRTVFVVFPHLDDPHPIVSGTRLTIGGTYTGEKIQVEAVSVR